MRIDDVSMIGKLGVAKKMLRAYEDAYELDPKHPDAVVGLYEYYRQAPGMAGGDKAKAEALFPVLKEVAPLRASLSQAMSAIEQEQWDDAYSFLNQARELEPENRLVQYLTAKVASLSGQHLEEAVTLLKEYLAVPVVESDNIPTHDGAWWRLGLIYEQLGNIPEAISCFETALTFDSDISKQIQQDLTRVRLKTNVPK